MNTYKQLVKRLKSTISRAEIMRKNKRIELHLMKPQVVCTTIRQVRDNKSIKTTMVPRPSYQTRLNQEHKQAQSKRRIIQ